jgi:hypothetical protein
MAGHTAVTHTVKPTGTLPGWMTHITKALTASPANIDAVYWYNYVTGITKCLPGRAFEAAVTGTVINELSAVNEITYHVRVAKRVGHRVRSVWVVTHGTVKLIAGGT